MLGLLRFLTPLLKRTVNSKVSAKCELNCPKEHTNRNLVFSDHSSTFSIQFKNLILRNFTENCRYIILVSTSHIEFQLENFKWKLHLYSNTSAYYRNYRKGFYKTSYRINKRRKAKLSDPGSLLPNLIKMMEPFSRNSGKNKIILE